MERDGMREGVCGEKDRERGDKGRGLCRKGGGEGSGLRGKG